MDTVSPKRFSSEALVSLGLAAIVGVGAFVALKTSVKYDERQIDSLYLRVAALEKRERTDREILVRLDERVLILDEKLDKVLFVVRKNSHGIHATK